VVVTLEEMKNYLRVDFEDDDALLTGIIGQSQQICMDVARISEVEVFENQPVAKIAVMYAVAYLYEHREEADHHALTLGLRALLFGVRSRDSDGARLLSGRMLLVVNAGCGCGCGK
jgi:uncharacterized phage protein (predicted DNA packaging)